MITRILAIESSCDETATAVIENGTTILSSLVASSSLIHKKYGGIVPEFAAREQIQSIIPVIKEALEPFKTQNNDKTYLQIIKDNIDAIAITIGPGLIGSLLVGVETAKTISYATGIPIIPVNHVIAHMYANFLDFEPSVVSHTPRKDSGEAGQSSANSCQLKAESRKLIAFPAISLVVSGGHTELFLMKSKKEISWLGGTLDDAAGEAFDKTARLLGFENRGGVAIEKAAQVFVESYQLSAISQSIKLPRPYLPDKPYSFSFSGLKTAVMREWMKCHPGLDPGSSSIVLDSGSEAEMTGNNHSLVNMFAYEIQESITEVLVKKTVNAAKKNNAKSILFSGGVASNIRLREKFYQSILATDNIGIHIPPPNLCTDNAAYIGACRIY